MNLKHINIFVAIIFFISITASAQVRIGDFNPSMFNFNKLNKKAISQFKGQTTKFVLPDFYTKEEYESILKEVWSVTPYEIVLLKDFDGDGVKEGDALVQFVSRFYKTSGGTDGFHSYRYFCLLDFILVDKVRKKPRKSQLKWEATNVGSIYFTQGENSPFQKKSIVFDYNYFPPVEEVEHLSNFRLGYLKNYLQFANKLLKNGGSFDIYEEYVDSELKKLKSSTLYVDKTLFEYNKYLFVANKTSLLSKNKKRPEEVSELMKNYLFNYDFVNYSQIEERIMDEEVAEDFYYLMYNQISWTKILTIINGKTGNVVYQDKQYSSVGLNKKDIKKLNSAFEKLKK